MARLPQVSGLELVAALKRGGWTEARSGRNHAVLRHATKPALLAVVPRHRTDLAPGTLRKILREIDMTVDELRSLL